jgi:dTDP-4-dehydrorhamnose 3,5-epimerase
MKLFRTPLNGVAVATTESHIDTRGSFSRFFCEADLSAALAGRRIVQVNHSLTAQRGTIRGLHYQRPPFAEMKLIRCIRGAAWDVVVDLRAGSPTFLHWHAAELTPGNGMMMILPEGCAHGFQALSADCELLYLHTAPYKAAAETGVAWNDARIGIAWPLPLPADGGLSQRDRLLQRVAADFAGVFA